MTAASEASQERSFDEEQPAGSRAVRMTFAAEPLVSNAHFPSAGADQWSHASGPMPPQLDANVDVPARIPSATGMPSVEPMSRKPHGDSTTAPPDAPELGAPPEPVDVAPPDPGSDAPPALASRAP